MVLLHYRIRPDNPRISFELPVSLRDLSDRYAVAVRVAGLAG